MTSRNFRPIYAYGGYSIRPVKMYKDGAELLHCADRKKIQCLALAKRENGVISITRDHSGHPPDDGLVEARIARSELRDQAKTTDLPPRTLLHDTKTKFGSRAIVVAGSNSALTRMIQRARDVKCVDTDAVDSQNPVFQGVMTLDNDKEPFLIFDEVNQTNGNRYVAFGSKVGLEVLEKSALLLSDGTFSVAQPPFVQLWTIHATFSESTFPVVHVLMSSRHIVDYDYVLRRLKSIIPQWDPRDYLGDLEIGQSTAIKNAFPNIRQTYCFFHLLQDWFRRLKQLKLQGLTVYGSSLYEFWSLLRCLPFGDPATAVQDFNDICTLLPTPLTAEMQSFVKYIRNFYVGPVRVLKFPPVTWNVSDRSFRHLPRTTNSVESQHRNLEACVVDTRGRSTPLLSELFKCLRQEASKLKFDKEALEIDPTYKV
ncbi:hypothetical protein GCK72_026226 [Caenorhabditis remanei]|uniref:MULE transposase domain-containing protein n=1 Tax=Caenorhabditis remanei TaxID=31234 RepID=A0A6A5G479_CAERE|nr:hypothetical protein GCK72_026226 [Caenorhabditis remanei]KAF1749757.1 hypothetical protein GCK72_026226 [Caenorhabditis remanei]